MSDLKSYYLKGTGDTVMVEATGGIKGVYYSAWEVDKFIEKLQEQVVLLKQKYEKTSVKLQSLKKEKNHTNRVLRTSVREKFKNKKSIIEAVQNEILMLEVELMEKCRGAFLYGFSIGCNNSNNPNFTDEDIKKALNQYSEYVKEKGF